MRMLLREELSTVRSLDGWFASKISGRNNVKLGIKKEVFTRFLLLFFTGKAAQQVGVPVPEGCTDPTARSDDGSCSYKL